MTLRLFFSHKKFILYKNTILFSVCRSSFAEGFNFNSDNSRMVIIAGFPYANINDTQIWIKMSFQDELRQAEPSCIPSQKLLANLILEYVNLYLAINF